MCGTLGEELPKPLTLVHLGTGEGHPVSARDSRHGAFLAPDGTNRLLPGSHLAPGLLQVPVPPPPRAARTSRACRDRSCGLCPASLPCSRPPSLSGKSQSPSRCRSRPDAEPLGLGAAPSPGPGEESGAAASSGIPGPEPGRALRAPQAGPERDGSPCPASQGPFPLLRTPTAFSRNPERSLSPLLSSLVFPASRFRAPLALLIGVPC